MKWMVFMTAAFWVLAGCSQGGSSDDGGIGQDASDGVPDGGQPGDGDSTDAGQDRDEILPDAGDGEVQDAGSDGDDPGPDPIPVCRRLCESPADCSSGNPGPYDQDNYSCSEGFCRWLGCLSDEDCQAQLGMEDYVCREDIQGYVGPSCFKSCLMSQDCALSVPAHDEDNWACTDGICEYLGCNNDAECRITPDFAHYVCTGQFTLVPMCMPGCFTPEDCDMGAPAYDADNYDCTDGICVYSGCNTDEECNLSDPTYEAACRW
jgi:hypothetical protein